jgi:serine protease Do
MEEESPARAPNHTVQSESASGCVDNHLRNFPVDGDTTVLDVRLIDWVSKTTMNQVKSIFLAGFAGALLGGAVLKMTAPPTAPVVTVPSVLAAGGGNAAVEQFTTGSFAPVVKRVTPAVVNISSSRVEKVSSANNPFMNDPFFRQFFGERMPQQPRERKAESLGSGVVVSPDGYILTNNHVVAGATQITVAFNDRREFKATLVGADPQTDIAVLRIKQTGLAALPLSDSTKVQTGDVVLAVGNPFGVGQTVTMGIISATGRRGLNIEGYEDFLQTDAAINPGNSGGALVNAQGELIGINTAIIGGGNGMGSSGGNVGIGFAIPVNMARDVMDQLVKSGKVTRSYMGAYLQDVDSQLAQAFNLKQVGGVAITKVEPGAPADRAGLKAGDVVLAMNGQPVADRSAFRLAVSRMAPGSTANLHINRSGQERDVAVKLEEMPKNFAKGPNDDDNDDNGQPGSQRGGKSALGGVSVDDLTPQIARQLQLPNETKGVVVTDVDSNSAAADAGLRRGDVILEVNRTAVGNTTEFDRALRNAGGKSTVLLISRGGVTNFVVIEPKQQ